MDLTLLFRSPAAIFLLVFVAVLVVTNHVHLAASSTVPGTTQQPTAAPKVCSGLLIASDQQLLVAKRQNCHIINGSLLLIGLYPERYPKGQLSLPSIRHVTGILLIHLVFTPQIRNVLPHLIAVHGIQRTDLPYDTDPALKEAYQKGILQRSRSGAALSQNLTVIISLNTVMSKPDLQGIAVYHGVVAWGSATGPVYFSQSYFPENMSVCDTISQISQPDNNTCCTISYNGDTMCSATTELGCVTAPVFQASLSTRAYCTYYNNDLISCASSCQQNTSLFLGRFCLNRCPVVVHPRTNSIQERYYSFTSTGGSSCLTTCPPDFQGNKVTATCDSCLSSQSSCIKYCQGTVVRSLTQLCSYVGCTHMNGDLILNINNPGLIPDCLRNTSGVTTVESALVRAFGKVRVLNGLLLILNNLCIYDLNFFQSLEEVNSQQTVFYDVRIYINQNNQMTSLKGLEKLIRVGGESLRDVELPGDIYEYIYISNNNLLCPNVIRQFYVDRSGLTNIPAANVSLSELVNAAEIVCPVGNFPLTARGVDSTTIELSWQSDSHLGSVFSQYIFYVEARNNTNKDFRQIVSTSPTADFSCVARLEHWSTIPVGGQVRKLNITNLRPCSEYAFQVEVLYTRDGFIITGNASMLILARPLLPKAPPSPNSFKINGTSRTSLQLTWLPPEYQCQDHNEQISYRVFWKKMSILPPVENLTLGACGKTCGCKASVGISTKRCIGSLLQRQLAAEPNRQLVSSANAVTSLQAQFHQAEDFQTSITPANCNSTGEPDCCKEGLFVRLGATSFNDTGVWADALSETTSGLSLTIPIEPLTYSESYVISVQAIHGSEGMSSTTWALTASIPPPSNADLVEGLNVSSAEDTLCLEWLPPSFQNSPPILYQLVMSSAKSQETSERQATCLQDYCMKNLQNCVTVNITSRTVGGNNFTEPVAAIADISPSLVTTQNGSLRYCLRTFTCSARDKNAQPGSLLLLFFQLRQITLAGCGPWSSCALLQVNTSETDTGSDNQSTSSALSDGQKALITVLSIAAFIFALVSVYLWKARRKSYIEAEEVRLMMERLQHTISLREGYAFLQGPGGDYVIDDNYEPDEWERSLEDITLLKTLGQGQFGQVFHGSLRQKTEKGTTEEFEVAIKTVHNDASKNEKMQFLKEACLMKVLDSEHLVRLIGIISGPEIYVIMEYMPHGDLKNYLRAVRPHKQPETMKRVPSSDMFKMWGRQLAEGMTFLTERKFVHRDLAARNCMIDGCYHLRVGDFGLARDVYVTDYYRRGTSTHGRGPNLLPLRWLAPESIKDGIFSSQSDVWSYGVVLWEMATLAQQPYRGLSNEDVVALLIKGGRMDAPDPELPFPNDLLQLMPRCWQTDPDTRPTFSQLVELLVEDEHYV